MKTMNLTGALRSEIGHDLVAAATGLTWRHDLMVAPPADGGTIASMAASAACMCSVCAQYLAEPTAAATTWTPAPGVTYITDRAEAYKALLFPGNALGPNLAINPSNLGKTAFVTYSLATEIPASLKANMLLEFKNFPTEVDALIASFKAYRDIPGGAEKVREALAAFTAVTGLIFLEVEAGKGEIEFATLDFGLVTGLSGLAGFAQPANGGALENASGGDVTMRTSAATDFAVLLHEIGHAVGLKHPFDGNVRLRDMSTEGSPDLTTLDTKEDTVMSYKGYKNPQPTTPYLGSFDKTALDYLYGAAAARPTVGTGAGQYGWDSATVTLTQIGTAAGDTLFGTASNDVMLGGDGADILDGKNGTNRLEGGAGNDVLKGGTGADTLLGGGDNDTLTGGGGIDILDGGNGDDTMTLTVGATIDGISVDGGAGTDTLTVFVSTGATPLTLDLSKLTIRNTETATFWAGAGGDTLSVDGQNSGTTEINAMAGDDTLTALAGGTGMIVLNGGDGSDVLSGGTGANVTLVGENGDDRLIAGTGLDVMTGGAGADRYVFTAAGDSTAASRDRITQFEIGRDKIVLGFAPALVTFERAFDAGGAHIGTLVKSTHGGTAFEVFVNQFNLTASDVELPAGATTRFEAVQVAKPAGEALYGTPAADTLTGGDGNDVLNGLGGADKLLGGGGDDTLWVPFAKVAPGYQYDGGAGTDRLVLFFDAPTTGPAYLATVRTTGIESVQVNGSGGNDHLFANHVAGAYSGGVILLGFDGDDILEGSAHWHQMEGGAGADTFYAGTGKGHLNAGADAATDTFVFRTVATSSSNDFKQITNFVSGQDKIVLNFTSTDMQVQVGQDNGRTVTNIFGTSGGTFFRIWVEGAITAADIQQLPGTTVKTTVTGATVWQDADGNGALTAGEVTANSGIAGSAFLTAGGAGRIVMTGGTNANTGLANVVTMIAPTGATAVNMLTTLLHWTTVATGDAVSALTKMRTALGLDASYDILSTDLRAAGSSGDAAAFGAFKVAAQVEAILAANIAESGGDTGIVATFLQNFGAKIATGAVIDLANAAAITANLVTTGTDRAATGVQAAITTGAIAAATTVEAVMAAQRAGALRGGTANDTLTGSDAIDVFDLSKGGDDVANGGGGDDGFFVGAAWSPLDRIVGGAGSDQIGLQGNYGGLTLSAASMTDVETLVFLPGSDTRFGDTSNALYSYNVISHDANIAAGGRLVVQGNALRLGENLTFDGSAERDGSFLFYGGMGTETLTGGRNDDGFYFGVGRFGATDTVDGGAGSGDQLGLQGHYAGANAVVFGAPQLRNVEAVVLLSGADTRFNGGGSAFSYTLTMHDGNALAGTTMVVQGNALRGDEVLTVDASAELNASYRIFAGAGADRLTGGAMDDEIWGGAGDDVIRGNAGADTLNGAAGADVIVGGAGADRLRGGDGNDRFVYLDRTDSTAGAATSDRILDFTTGDVIDVFAAGFTRFAGTSFSRLGGDITATYTGTTWLIQGDADANGIADLSIEVDQSADFVWSATNFVFQAIPIGMVAQGVAEAPAFTPVMVDPAAAQVIL